MKLGFIKAGGERLSWTPLGEKQGWTRWSVSPNGVKLGNYSFFKGDKVNASYCMVCRKIIIDA